MKMEKRNYSYTPLYYATPCPVRFYLKGQFLYGTGIEEYIVAGTAKFLIEDIIDAAQDDGIFWDDAIVERG